MQRRAQILLDVWREACRHIEISDFTDIVAPLLTKNLPLERLVVRRFDRDISGVLTVAAAPRDGGSAIPEDRRVLESAEFRQILRWAESDRLLERGKRLTGVLGWILPDEFRSADLLAVPLAHETGTSGALLLVVRSGHQPDSDHLELIEKLREPFAVALQNDRRLREIATLREAAEADRGTLLRRLGRKELLDEIVGEDSGLKVVMERVNLVARSDAPVLILGETGTGKEVVARAIHNRSERHDGPFIRVNCGAIPSELIDSQLFGHERGSFTGAEQTRQGWFERADNGTLLLDEIGELPLEAQVRFLRVLQDGFVERVGGTRAVQVNVRIVAATHRDLAQMVREGRFREDLWYRLAVFPILMPPLRDRQVDLPGLARHFAERAAVRFGLPVNYPVDEDLRLLAAYHWPGNIRELGAVIDRATILGNGASLEIAKSLGFTDTPAIQATPSAGVRPAAALPRTPLASPGAFPTLNQAMKAHIERALRAADGRVEGVDGAAELLQINPHTLRARMRKLGINWSQFRDRKRHAGFTADADESDEI